MAFTVVNLFESSIIVTLMTKKQDSDKLNFGSRLVRYNINLLSEIYIQSFKNYLRSIFKVSSTL